MFAVLKHLFKLQFLLILIAVFAGIYYPNILDILKSWMVELADENPISLKFSADSNNPLYTKEALSKFTGETEDQPIYLSILGTVYDVTKGRKHYGPGCSYSFFAGRDASKSFISGEFEHFTEDSDDVMSLSPSDILSLYEWKKFYDKEYTIKGLAVGRFYNENGIKTKYFHQLDAIVDQAVVSKQNESDLRELYPPCNIEWTEVKGTRVWCTNTSGGKKRDWVGVPRKYFEPGQTIYRCACIKESDVNSPNLQPYDNCDPLSQTCFYKIDD